MMIFNRVLGLLLGVALAAAGALLLVELALALSGQSPAIVPLSQWDGTLRGLNWGDDTLVATLVAAAVVGALLLAAELWPRRPALLPLSERRPGRAAAIQRRGLQDHLRRVALEDPDVVGARARAGRRKAKVDARMAASADSRQVRERLKDAVNRAVEAIGFTGRFRASISVSRAEQRPRTR